MYRRRPHSLRRFLRGVGRCGGRFLVRKHSRGRLCHTILWFWCGSFFRFRSGLGGIISLHSRILLGVGRFFCCASTCAHNRSLPRSRGRLRSTRGFGGGRSFISRTFRWSFSSNSTLGGLHSRGRL